MLLHTAVNEFDESIPYVFSSDIRISTSTEIPIKFDLTNQDPLSEREKERTSF